MQQPTLTTTGQRAYDSLTPLATQDAQFGWALAYLCGAMAAMFDPIADIVRDQDDGSPGWSTLFKIQAVNSVWLPWLAQFVGVVLTGITDPNAQRQAIENLTNFQRGSTKGLATAAALTLTGSQTVLVTEFYTGGAWNMHVVTWTEETPNPQVTLNIILAMKRIGIVLTYETLPKKNYAVLAASHPTYSAMEAVHTNYDDLRRNPGA